MSEDLGQAGAEIEITPEMIEAAETSLSGFNGEFSSYDEGAFEIIVAAMDAAHITWLVRHPSLSHLAPLQP